MKKIIKSIWKIICYPLLYMGIQLIIYFAYTFVIGIILGIKLGIEIAASGEAFPPQNEINEMAASWIDLRIPVIISIFITFILIFLIIGKEWKSDEFWNISKIKASPILLCILLGAALNAFTISIVSMLPHSWQRQPIDGMIGDNIIIEIIGLALLVPILEEIIFRGIVLKRLTKTMKLQVALILQALIFAVIHFNLLQGTYAFILGIIIGAVYIRFDSIWYAVALHVIYNSTSIIIIHIAGDSELNLLYFMVISILILMVSSIGLIILAHKRDEIAKNTINEKSIVIQNV